MTRIGSTTDSPDRSARAVTQAPNSAAATGGSVHEGNVKLLPWLMMTALFSGLALGLTTMAVVNQSQSEARTRAELERQNRFLQEYRIRVEDAEIAAEEVNPKFHPRRTE